MATLRNLFAQRAELIFNGEPSEDGDTPKKFASLYDDGTAWHYKGDHCQSCCLSFNLLTLQAIRPKRVMECGAEEYSRVKAEAERLGDPWLL